MEKSEIRDTRIKKERELLQQNISQNYTIDFSENNDLIELTTVVHGFPVIFYIDIPDRYPFEPPNVSLSQNANLTTLTEFSKNEDILEQVLNESWLPVKNLIEVSEKLVLYAQLSFKPKDKALIIDIFSILPLWSIISVVLFSLLTRVSVMPLSHANGNLPHLYGEYESYRHWMEVTYRNDSSVWYQTSDYLPMANPPLNAFFCWAMSFFSTLADPHSITGPDTRGYVSAPHKIFMKTTAICAELIFFTISLLLFFKIYYRNFTIGVKNSACMIILISPSFTLITHVLFSFNIISIGFTLISIILIIQDHIATATIFLTFAINFKKECIVYAFPLILALFIKIYSRALRMRNNAKIYLRTVVMFAECTFGLVSVLISFFITSAVLWSPWLHSKKSFETVVSSIFMSDEDFSGRIPTFLSILHEFEGVSEGSSRSIGVLMTVAFAAPFMLFLLTRKPFGLSLLHCLSGVSLAFYLFSDHEENFFILMPLMPFALLTIIDYPEVFRLVSILFSMSQYPSLVAIQTRSSYFGLILFFYIVSSSYIDTVNYFQNQKKINLNFWYFSCILVHLTEIFNLKLFQTLHILFVFTSLLLLYCWILKNHYQIREEITQKYHIEKRFRKKNKTT